MEVLNQAVEIPEVIFLIQSIPEKELLKSTVRALDSHGNKIGAGMIDRVQVLSNGNRLASVRLIIGEDLYIGSLNWDKTRSCHITMIDSFAEISV